MTVQAPAADPGDVNMSYQIAPLFCRPWTLLGIERKLIESHYENNYGGAFARLNTISEELAALDPATTPPHVIRRLKQDEAAALNSLALHELYFASLGGDGRAIPELMANALARDFGSVDRWRSEFVALANSLDAGSGWVLLTWLPRAGRLINQCVCEGSPAIAGGITVLALDMHEHAYHTLKTFVDLPGPP
jgi:Fe-Mn family superoxide dismutase